MLCHVGPDAGWPVLRPFLEATKKTLSVAMYDFNADYIAKSFIETVRDKDLQGRADLGRRHDRAGDHDPHQAQEES